MADALVVPPLKKGEYDLVNISILGFDPVTGRSFDECNAEFNKWLNAVEVESLQLRWWQFRRRYRLWTNIRLHQRQGM